jgi:hypothetical protein
MRKDEMRIGQEYTMQRGPTKRPLRVTLLAKDVPSAMNNRVMVRIEEGVSMGKEREAPSLSISPLSGSEPVKPKPKKGPEPEPVQEAPPGWEPKKDEQVTWAQTLTIPMTVLEVQANKGIAKIEGYVFGELRCYDAPVSQLVPIKPKFTPVDQLPTRPRASTSSPVSRAESPEPEKAGLPLIVRDEDILDRLTFDPKVIVYYRNRFAKGMGLQRAEAKLRAELGQAEQKRKHPGRQYLTFIVPGKFEVSLKKRPISEEPDSCYVRGITVLNRAKKRKAA